jgi:superoxide dismutase, Fe-Mn family
MTYSVPPLPYDYGALDASIDEQTMRLHHDKHHQAYVDKLNDAVNSDSSLQGKSWKRSFATLRRCRRSCATTAGGTGTTASSGKR